MEQPYSSIREDLYLVFQPIIQLISKDRKEITEFEVLLRSKTTGAYPGNLMDQFITSEELNKHFLSWYLEEMEVHCQRYPDYVFNVNIHPQQFLHSSTWCFLKKLREYTHQVNIEITEKHICSDDYQLIPHQCIGTFIIKWALTM